MPSAVPDQVRRRCAIQNRCCQRNRQPDVQVGQRGRRGETLPRRPDDLDGRFTKDTGLIVDFNGDLWVSGFDISIVLSNMGATRIQEWLDPAVGGP